MKDSEFLFDEEQRARKYFAKKKGYQPGQVDPHPIGQVEPYYGRFSGELLGYVHIKRPVVGKRRGTLGT
jgi:hypothetical protein